MRTFIAIELSDELKASLARVQSHLKCSDADVKWVEKENIHLTLKFLGEITEDKAANIKTIMDKIGSSSKPFKISLKDIGAFPNTESPRIIWVGLNKGAEESAEITKRLEEELSKIGFEFETRPFAAHLTIGRVRSLKNKEALKEKICSSSASIFSTNNSQWIISLTLFQSTLTSKGSIYTKLHEARLA